MGAGGKIIIGIISLLIVYYIFNLGNDKKRKLYSEIGNYCK